VTQFDVMKDEYRRIMVNGNLRKVLKPVKRVKSAIAGIQETEESELHEESEEEEIPEESPSEIEARYKNSEMCEVSDPELCMHYNHGENSPSSGPSQDDPLDNEAALHRAMVETNGVLTARERRLPSEWNEAEARNDVIAMEEIEGLLVEVRDLRHVVMQSGDAIIACGMQKNSTELELSTPTFEMTEFGIFGNRTEEFRFGSALSFVALSIASDPICDSFFMGTNSKLRRGEQN